MNLVRWFGAGQRKEAPVPVSDQENVRRDDEGDGGDGGNGGARRKRTNKQLLLFSPLMNFTENPVWSHMRHVGRYAATSAPLPSS